MQKNKIKSPNENEIYKEKELESYNLIWKQCQVNWKNIIDKIENKSNLWYNIAKKGYNMNKFGISLKFITLYSINFKSFWEYYLEFWISKQIK